VEFLAEPYYHSLASELSKEEFIEQIKLSLEAINKLFNYSPIGAVNTEMIYRSDIGVWLRELGFKYIVTEGVESVFYTRDPNNLYQDSSGLLLFARQYRLSDDIAFRFSMTSWDQYPLTADKYASWIKDSPGDFVVVYVDFETFGEHHWPATGILEFLRYLPREFSKRGIKMISFSEALKLFRPIRELSINETISWANERKDLSAWLGNELQRRAFELYKWVGKLVLESGIRDLITIWRILGEADHYHYMYYTRDSSLAVHDYFSYHENPFIAFEAYVKALMILYYYSRRI
jgi:alpha-amylase